MSKRRPTRKRQIKDTVLLVCGGETEKWYFDNFSKVNSKINIVTTCKNSVSSPMKVVDYAIKLKKYKKVNDGIEYLKVFAIFDKDDFNDFDLAISKALKNDISPIFSNQSFELWFLQFFAITSNPLDRKQYKKKLDHYFKQTSRKCIKYSKTKKSICEIYDCYNSYLEKGINNCKINFQKKNTLHIEQNAKFSNLESVSNIHILIEELISLPESKCN